MHPPQDYLSILRDERKRLINTLRETKFSQLDAGITHQQIIPFSSYAPWEDDAEFNEVYHIIYENTLVDKYRCYELWSLAQQMKDEDADIIEVGAWRGGTAGILARANKRGKGKLYIADTFTGVVKAGSDDTLYKGGEHADTSQEIVIQLLNRLKIDEYNLMLGIFPDDFKDFPSKKIKFCHIDVDTYLSAKGILDFIWPILIKGGVIVFDDYGFFGCEGVTKFVNQLNLDDARFIYNINGHAILIKK